MIDFNMNGNSSNAMAGDILNLEKGGTLDLTKRAPGIKNVKLGIGWDAANARSMYPFDLDISVFLLNANGKVTSIPADVIFYNNRDASGVHLNGDNRTGDGNGDDEIITIDFSKLPPYVEKIACYATIDQASVRNQVFGMINNSWIHLVNADTNKDLCRFDLKDNASVNNAVCFAELWNDHGNWTFKAIGEGMNGDLNVVLNKYR